MYRLRLLLLLGVCLMFSGCYSTKVEHYADQEPTINLRDFFTGEIRGWGLVQDRKGRVIKRFDFDMVGRWDGNNGVLDEEFVYYDGDKQSRSWRIEDLGGGKYRGEADDVIGEAQIDQSGSALNLRYELVVPIGNSDYRFKFDDWMWRMNDGVVINRAVMRKFGVRVAELTVVMQKQ